MQNMQGNLIHDPAMRQLSSGLRGDPDLHYVRNVPTNTKSRYSIISHYNSDSPLSNELSRASNTFNINRAVQINRSRCLIRAFPNWHCRL
jgi:hypothetical protein